MRCLPPQALTVTSICESRPDGARESLKRVSHRSGDTQAQLRQNDSHHMRCVSLSCLLYLLSYRLLLSLFSRLLFFLLLVQDNWDIWALSSDLFDFYSIFSRGVLSRVAHVTSHPFLPSSLLFLPSSFFLLLPPLPPCFQCCANRSDALRSLATLRVSLSASPAARFKGKRWLCSLFL